MSEPTAASPSAVNGAWDIAAARTTYNIDRWGAGYFDIDDHGHVVAKPLREKGASVDLTDLIEEAKSRGLKSRCSCGSRTSCATASPR